MKNWSNGFGRACATISLLLCPLAAQQSKAPAVALLDAADAVQWQNWTGELGWRWFVVPGDPSKPYEDESMEAAARTWDPAGKYWIVGGGGTPWDSITYDPDLDLVYYGSSGVAPASEAQRNARLDEGAELLVLPRLGRLTRKMGPPLNPNGDQARIYSSRRRVTTPRPTSRPSQRLKWLPMPR